MTFALMGPVGELRPAPAPEPGVSVNATQTTNQWMTLGENRFTQGGKRIHRDWTLSFTWDRPEELAWLAELASGSVPGPIYLYTAKAAVENLAPPALQNCGSGVTGRRRVLAAGDREVGVSRKIPIKPSTAYMVSALTSGSGSVTRKIYNEAGVELASVALAAGASGVRVSASFTTPATAAYMTLTLTAGIGQVRLTEGAHTGFMPGDGVAPIQVMALQEVLQRVMAGDHRSDFTCTVMEVG